MEKNTETNMKPIMEPIKEMSCTISTNYSKTEKESVKKLKPEVKKQTLEKCFSVSDNSSHTKFYKKPRHEEHFQTVSRNEYLSISESMSGSSDNSKCVSPDAKEYSEKALLKRAFIKNLDPAPIDPKWNDECPPAFDWGMAAKLEFMIVNTIVEHQMDRLQAHLRDFAKITSEGYKNIQRIDTLSSSCIITDYVLESLSTTPALRETLVQLLQNMNKPILLKGASDVVTYLDMITHYIGFMGYLLIRLEDDQLFDLVSKALIWHLSAPDSLRGPGTVHLRHTLAAAAPVLQQTTPRMIAVASSHRFPIFLEIALLLACDTVDNCIQMMKENILENIFYRFNPYFPDRQLPSYDINPYNCQDYKVKLGDSGINMPTTLSLLLVLVKTTRQFLDENPKHILLLPSPDCYAQRCFIWAYRYECRVREHRHERITLTVIASVLLKCFGDKLLLFSSILMPDVMTLSVFTELPPRGDWTGTVNFNTAQQDVQFKKILIYFVVDLLKVFPYNKFMLESRHWMLGIMYLLDPGLCHLRSRWSPSLFAELRKTALQALVCILPLAEHRLIKQYGLIRRILWYIEWYSESPYDIRVLYWCVRLLQVAILRKTDPGRQISVNDLFETHGIIILIHLCYTLMEQKLPPMEKSQAVLAQTLRLLTSAALPNRRVSCCVYKDIKWPSSAGSLARKMLDVVLFSLDKHFIISDRWLISLLNFIWEAIIWKQEYRQQFVANDGMYKLLDIITMTRSPVQCIALALVCDVTRAGDAVGQLVSWRANLGAANAHPNLVPRGSTIATLLAAVFRDECLSTGVRLNEHGVLQDLDSPIMSMDAKKELLNSDFKYIKGPRNQVCLAAGELAGSRMSKAFAILHLLTEDLEKLVKLADQSYNLYKNIKLAPEDEAVLVLCSHYLTLKLNEVWKETQVQSTGMVPKDDIILEDFLNLGKTWAKEIKRQQEDIIAKDQKKDHEEECSFYAFLGRVRLNIALDALRAVRCVSRSSDRDRITHALINDAVFAHHRRSVFARKANTSLLKTFKPPLDDQNLTGQNVKVISIAPKNQPVWLQNSSESTSETHSK